MHLFLSLIICLVYFSHHCFALFAPYWNCEHRSFPFKASYCYLHVALLYWEPFCFWCQISKCEFVCVWFACIEGRFGKDGKDKDQENKSQFQPLYTLDEHAYDLDLNFTLSLEDWAHFSRSVDHTYTFLSNRNRPCSHDLVGGARARDCALVSFASGTASVVYLTTLATPALLLREAGTELLREALGLRARPHASSSAPPTSSPPPLSTRLLSSSPHEDRDTSEEIVNTHMWSGRTEGEKREEEQEEDSDEDDEGEVFTKTRTGRRKFGTAHCDCSYSQVSVWLSVWTYCRYLVPQRRRLTFKESI